MKLQCSCGAKYAFDTTPEMVQNPVKFICPGCGRDSSAFVNELIRREYGVATPAPSPVPEAAAAPEPQASAAAPVGSRLRISREQAAAAPAEPAPPVSKYCSRHRSELTTEYCVICRKPICPKCLVEFGYFCSPLCRGKAEAQNIAAPVFAGQKFEADRRYWQKTGLIFGSIAGAIVLFLGAWTWYAWFGSVPHTYFSVRFDDNNRAHSGRSELVGRDQLVFLHGALLARYDLKGKKQVWSQQLVTPDQIAATVKLEEDEEARESARTGGTGRGEYGSVVTPQQREKEVRDQMEAALMLRVSGSNVWIGKLVESTNTSDEFAPPDYQLTHYDWDSGRILQQITVPMVAGDFIERKNELMLLNQTDVGAAFVTHVSLADGTISKEEFYDPGATKELAAAGAGPGAGRNNANGGLFPKGDQALDPQKVAAQAQNLTLPARIALPALLGNAQHERQLESALKDSDDSSNKRGSRPEKHIAEHFQLIPSENGYIQFASHLLEEKFETRSAMKAPPAKSALNDPNLNASQTADVANEILNGMQRDNGGGTVTEDVSRYQVSLRRTDSPDVVDWTGEVVGPPQIFPLKTVNVITAGKTVIVFDKTNKKLWEATLTYSVLGGDTEFFKEAARFGAGPAVEHGDTLYVFDQAVLTAFDLATGNARWRLPSVGIVGLFFDDQGMVYVNTTSASPDDIKYSRQIDITKSTDDVLLKVDPQTGKTLWSIKPGGFISYVSGKFIYAIQSYDPNPDDEEELNDTMAGLQKPAYLRLIRISPKDGRTLWDYEQDRCPIDWQFNENSIQFIFKREVQVLRYLSF